MKYKYLLSQVLDLLLISIGYFLMLKKDVISNLSITLFLILLLIYFIIYPIKNKKLTLGQKFINLSINNLEKRSYVKLLLINGIFYLSLLMFFLPIKVIYILFIIYICLNLLDIGLIDIFSKEMPFINNENKYNYNGVYNIFKFSLANIIDIFIFVIPFSLVYFLKDDILLINKNNVYILNDISFVVIIVLMLFYYYFYYVKVNNGSTIGMQIIGISMKKNKKDKEKNTFLNVGFLSFSFWFYIFLVFNLYHNYFLILTPVLLQLIYIYIILICVNNNIKIKKYNKVKPKSKKIIVSIIIILLLSLLSLKVTNNKEYYHLIDNYNTMLNEEDYWNEKGVYTKEQMQKIKGDLKEINISSLKDLKNLIEDKDMTSNIEYINLNKEVGSKYFKDDISYLQYFSNLKSLNINILADKFDLKYQYGYNYTDQEENEYSLQLIEKLKKENKEFFNILEKNNIKYEINVKFN